MHTPADGIQTQTCIRFNAGAFPEVKICLCPMYCRRAVGLAYPQRTGTMALTSTTRYFLNHSDLLFGSIILNDLPHRLGKDT